VRALCPRDSGRENARRDKKKKREKSPPIIITIIVSRKISAILPTRTRTHKRVVGLLNPSLCKRSLAKHRGNASLSRIHPRELLKICWLRFIHSSNNNNVTRRVRVQLLYINKSIIYIHAHTHTHKYMYIHGGGNIVGVGVEVVVASTSKASPVPPFSREPLDRPSSSSPPRRCTKSDETVLIVDATYGSHPHSSPNPNEHTSRTTYRRQ